jgi:hypothetical protein
MKFTLDVQGVSEKNRPVSRTPAAGSIYYLHNLEIRIQKTTDAKPGMSSSA